MREYLTALDERMLVRLLDNTCSYSSLFDQLIDFQLVNEVSMELTEEGRKWALIIQRDLRDNPAPKKNVPVLRVEDIEEAEGDYEDLDLQLED